ncbi:putative transporter like protein [Verticillium longisporum]|uniref:Putative transporter like protein n=1 Tax=Verticillium longisporum TaxID=100787 RepID=A0A8I3AXF5_VERLO|nr:putative transporter like protein [Verticillium longisporum]
METSKQLPGRNGEKGVDSEPQTDQNSIESADVQEWSHKEELKARRKVDSTVLPLLFLGLLVFQLDRMNLASALTDGFAVDIAVTQETINLGKPAHKLGPRRWISAQVFIFGLVATMQFLLVNRTGFLVARLILGFSEAGYIPGAVYTLSMWYPKRELAKRVAIFFFGMFGGNALSPVLASGILQLGGRAGLKGWQWLFLRESPFCAPFLLTFASRSLLNISASH